MTQFSLLHILVILLCICFVYVGLVLYFQTKYKFVDKQYKFLLKIRDKLIHNYLIFWLYLWVLATWMMLSDEKTQVFLLAFLTAYIFFMFSFMFKSRDTKRIESKIDEILKEIKK